MAFSRLSLWTVVGFAASSLQQAEDPLANFCRRWSHQTAVIDDRLYIDGGLVSYNSANTNETNTLLLYSDLTTVNQSPGMPLQYANLSKNGNIPSVSGGVLWPDTVNKAFYLYGGEYQTNPKDFSFWAYDVLMNQWNETKFDTNVNSMERLSYGAGATADELGVGFYYGGWMNENTSPSYKGDPVASSGMIRYDFGSSTLNNNSGPDTTGRAEGSLHYLPAGNAGILVYFGGVEDQDGIYVGANMSTIHIHDIDAGKWYTQEAKGNVPDARRQFGAGATHADDFSSYNIYLYGGYNTDLNNVTAFDDVYILSMPSFTWIRAWPSDNQTTDSGHGGMSANVIRNDQMIILGGHFPKSSACDSPSGYGQHNMVLGMNGAAGSLWDAYLPNQTIYEVPQPVLSVIGGGPTGGATATAPANNFENRDLSVFFARTPSFSARTATRSVPGSTGSSTGSAESSSSKSHKGAIAGGIVGGLAFLAMVLGLVLFCLHRRKKALKSAKADNASKSELGSNTPHESAYAPDNKGQMQDTQSPLTTPQPVPAPAFAPVELAASETNVYELADPPESTRYKNLHNQAQEMDASPSPHYSQQYPQSSSPPALTGQPSPYQEQGHPHEPNFWPSPTSPGYPPVAHQDAHQTGYPSPPDQRASLAPETHAAEMPGARGSMDGRQKPAAGRFVEGN